MSDKIMAMSHLRRLNSLSLGPVFKADQPSAIVRLSDLHQTASQNEIIFSMFMLQFGNTIEHDNKVFNLLKLLSDITTFLFSPILLPSAANILRFRISIFQEEFILVVKSVFQKCIF